MRALFSRHPSRRARIEYALGDASMRDRASIAAHLLACVTCRDEVEAVAFLQRDMRALGEAPPTAAPPMELLDQVIAERADGMRAFVPPTTPRRTRQRATLLFAFAGAAALLLAFSMRPKPRIAVPAIPELATDLFGPTLAFAQEGIPVDPSAFDTSRIASLRGARAEYRVQWFTTAGEESAAIRIVERLVVPSAPGAPMVIVRTTPRPAGALVDSLVIDRRSLAPILQVLRRSRFRIVDSIADGVLVRSFPARDRGGPIVTRTTSRPVPRVVADRPFLLAPGIALPLYLRTAVIGPGNRIAVVELGARSGEADSLSPGTRTIVARVVGEDRVTTPAGTFDAWRLELEHTPRGVRQLLWLDKGSQVLVQTRRLVDGTRSMETVLERLSR